MPDLVERLRELDRIEPPDVWSDVVRLGPRTPVEPGPSPLRRAGVALLALALAVASFLLVDRAFRGRPAHQPGETPSPTISAVGPAGNGLIAFGCGGYRICTMAPDGSGTADLIEKYDKSLVLAAYSPAWSPDGNRIAFSGYNREGSSSGGGANYDVYVMNADGSDLRNLTTSPDDVERGASQGPPVWSPDGTMLAFEGDDGKVDGLYVVNTDGTGLKHIAAGGWPAWSPDGSRILFTLGVPHGSDLYTVLPNGTGAIQLTDAPGWDQEPSWSPDGTKIAFVRSADKVESVYVMNADGSNEHAVFSENGLFPYRSLWSPDGTRLLFEAETTTAHGNYDLYVVDVDGSSATDLTPTQGRAENSPVWSPDGTLIAFEATTQLTVDTADYQIYLIRPDGTHEQRITTDRAGYSLAWQGVAATPTT